MTSPYDYTALDVWIQSARILLVLVPIVAVWVIGGVTIDWWYER